MGPNVKRSVLIILTIVILGIIGFRIAFKISQGNKKAEPVIIAVETQKLKKQTIQQMISFQGILQGDPQVKVFPQVTGKFQNNTVQEGAYIYAGTPIVYINRDIVGSDYLLAPVNSPISGTVIKLYYNDNGDTVTPGQPVAEVANIKKVKVELNVGQEDLMKVKYNQSAVIYSTIDESNKINAIVSSVTPFVDSETLSGSITVKAFNPGSLKIGMSVGVDVMIGKITAYMIPEEAIIMQLDSLFVFINRDGIAKSVQVTRGYSKDGLVEVQGDLSEEDQLIVQGSFKLYDGAKISVVK